MSNTQSESTTRDILSTDLSIWQAALSAMEKSFSTPEMDPTWIGFDATGNVIVGDGEPVDVPVVVVAGDDLQELYRSLDDWSAFRESGGSLSGIREARNVDALARMVDYFERVICPRSCEGARCEPTVHYQLFGPWGPKTTTVRYAEPKPLERVLAHIAIGCTHCRRPKYLTPESRDSFDVVLAWSRRWEPTGLSASEAAMWTHMVDCRPEVAMELRASGCSVDRLRLAVNEWCEQSNSNLADFADMMLEWVHSGFSWAEIERWGAPYSGAHLLPVARELRGRGFDEESCAQVLVEWEGETQDLFDFLICERTVTLEETLAWLEQQEHVSTWLSGLEGDRDPLAGTPAHFIPSLS